MQALKLAYELMDRVMIVEACPFHDSSREVIASKFNTISYYLMLMMDFAACLLMTKCPTS